MFNFKNLLFAGVAVIMLTAGISANANAENILASIRVMLPNGTYLSLDNTPDRPWYHDQRLAAYQRYYYDPVRRVYVVYNGDNRPGSYVIHHHRRPRPIIVQQPAPRPVIVVQQPAPRPIIVHRPAPPPYHDPRGDIDHNDHNDHHDNGNHNGWHR